MDGSLLGLDVALSNLALRQMASERVPPVPALDINDRAMLAAAVVLTNPHDVGDTESTMIAGAIGAGRDRVEKNRTAPAELGAMLADVGADEWRVRAAEWLATRDPERVPDLLSLADLFWLGAGATGEAATLDAFGPAMATTSACLCTRFPAPQSWDVGTGREGAGFLTSRFGDLKLRIVETLAELKLPAALLPGVLAVATPDFISEAAPVHRDDWLTLARQVQRIPKSRFEDYIATLTASGPLVPIEAQKRFPTPQ